MSFMYIQNRKGMDMQTWNEIVLVKREKFPAGEELTYEQICRLDDLITVFTQDTYLSDDDVTLQDFYAYEFHPRSGSYLYDAFGNDPSDTFGKDMQQIESDFVKGGASDHCYLIYEMAWVGGDYDEPSWTYKGVLDTESLAIVT